MKIKKFTNAVGMSKIGQYAVAVNKKVIDAERGDLEIELRSIDVKTARRAVHGDCAFSRACRRQDPQVLRAIFFRTTAYLEFGDRLVRYKCSKTMSRMVEAFDRGKEIKLGRYLLKQPSASKKLGVSHRRRSGSPNPGPTTPKMRIFGVRRADAPVFA